MLSNLEWLNLFPSAYYHTMAPLSFDYSPLITHMQSPTRKSCYFIFINYWILHLKFICHWKYLKEVHSYRLSLCFFYEAQTHQRGSHLSTKLKRAKVDQRHTLSLFQLNPNDHLLALNVKEANDKSNTLIKLAHYFWW